MKNSERCPATIVSEGYSIARNLRCQLPVGHDRQCAYHRKGGQGGSLTRWWGANPRPVGWIDDLSNSQLSSEIWRLRNLCDDHEVDWRADLIEVTS